MKAVRCSKLMVILFLGMGIFLFPAWQEVASAGEQAKVTNEDCLKCHPGPPADIAAAGGRHAGVGCLACHVGHPPAVKHPIPQCSQCHRGKTHFDLTGCLNCHNNPHTPLKISFPVNITDACLTCHRRQIAQLRENTSRHSALNCSTCHSAHRLIPQCTQCHKPHSDEMAAGECRKCHKAHMPKVVTYPADIPSRDCGACHRKAFDLLNAGKTRHKDFACAFCHQERHKMIPDCRDCHGSPHPAGMTAKFPKCGDCHNIAHDLNNWPVTKKEALKKEQ